MSEKVKITIRLPAALVKEAKLYAVALDEDLQDFVARALRDYMNHEPLAPLLLDLARRRQAQTRGRGAKGRRAKVKTTTVGAR
jgi:hypothetical protein